MVATAPSFVTTGEPLMPRSTRGAKHRHPLRCRQGRGRPRLRVQFAERATPSYTKVSGFRACIGRGYLAPDDWENIKALEFAVEAFVSDSFL